MPKVAVPFVRDENNYDRNAVSRETGLVCEDESLTVQSEAEDADINTIVRRFGITGQLPQTVVLPEFADYEDIFDYRSAIEAVRDAERRFMELPADIRRLVDNDPQKFLEFVADERNGDKLIELGLRKPVVEVAAATAGGEGTESPEATE